MADLDDKDHGALFDLLVEAASTDFASYLELFHPQGNDHIILGKLHYALAERLQHVVDGQSAPFQCVSVPPQHGKLLDNNTPVLTPQGWKRHGELHVGDQVFHPSGQVTSVIAESVEDFADVEITLSTGEKIICHENHEWTVTKDKRGPVTVEARQLLSSRLWRGEKGKRGSRMIWQLPRVVALDMPDVWLPIDPYAFGAWLGDGKSTDFSLCGVDPEVFEAIPYSHTFQTWHKDTGVEYRGYAGHGLRAKLRELGVFNDKFIPAQYLVASQAQRLELLAGLLDTDGSLHRRTGQYRFINTNPRLVRDVVTLIRSFGWSCSTSWTAPGVSSGGIEGTLPVCQVGFTPDRVIPCRIPRKQSTRCTVPTKVGIAHVCKIDKPRRGKCIQVAADDGLYLVGRTLQPTHNSTILSVEGVSWLMGHNPGICVALTGFSYSLCTAFAKKVRDRIDDPLYKLVFPGVSTKEGFNKADEYELTNGSSLVAKSAGSKLTGRRVDFLVIDDPHPGRAEAESVSQRTKVVEWFNADCVTRLSPNAKVFLIGTRWHPDDLIGAVTGEEHVAKMRADGMDHMVFDVINFAAICETERDSEFPDPLGRDIGDALFPEVRNEKFLMGLKSTLPNYEWESQYQGRPMTGASGQADIASLVFIDYAAVPNDLVLSRGWDLAISEKQRSDYTAGFLCGYNRKRKELYIIHGMRAKMGWAKLRAKLISRALADIDDFGCRRCRLEAVSGFDAVFRDVKQELAGKVRVRKSLATNGDKIMRAQPWLNLIEVNRVYVVRGPWNKDFLTELEQFPDARNDDQVDGISIAYEDVVKAGSVNLA